MSAQTTPAAVLAELARLQRETKALRDRETRRHEERRRMAIARVVDRAHLDALALVTVAMGGGLTGRTFAPLPQRRWAYAAGLLRMAGLADPGRDLHVRTDLSHAEILARLERAATAAQLAPRRYAAHLPAFLVPKLLRDARAV